MKRCGLGVGTLVLLLTPSVSVATEVTAPLIVTQATGEVSATPDHAIVTVGVQHQEASATAAAEKTAAGLQAVLAALNQLGYSQAAISTSHYTITPVYRFVDDQRRLDGYQASVGIEVKVTRLTELGQLIDKVLSAGANEIGAIRFGLNDRTTPRKHALERAFRRAREDAEILAGAAGRPLGALIEISTVAGGDRPFGVERTLVSAQGTELPTGDITIAVTVTTRWRID